MAERGAQPGNKNAAKKPWTAAIYRALEARTVKKRRESLDALAENLLKQCDGGDMAALKELGDRLEGKPAQEIKGELEITSYSATLDAARKLRGGR